jgi:hypothetical protein
MAVLLEIMVTDATQNEFNELDASVGRAMTAAGGPPPGLMSHVVYAEGAGFIIAEVWRVESEGHRYLNEVLRPRLAELGLTGDETRARPVWSFARP